MGLKKDNAVFLGMLFSALLVVSNILSAKLITLGQLVVPGGIICYALTFLISDVIGENYGKESAKTVARYGLITQLLLTVLIWLTVLLPGDGSETTIMLDRVLATNLWFTIAGLIGYAVAQSLDILIFHRIRERLRARGKHYKWVWNNVSTIISQTIDTIIYVGIAFGIGMQIPIGILVQLVLSQIAVKVILAIVDTPIFYLMTRRANQ